METKKCGRCKKVKKVELFSKNSARKDSLNSFCKECQTAYQKEWYLSNREKHIRRAVKHKISIIADNRERMAEYFKEHPCLDCGETDPIVLDFDHVRGVKRAHVAKLLGRGCSWEVIAAEIEKCEVRCANCHRRVTHKRRKINAGIA